MRGSSVLRAAVREARVTLLLTSATIILLALWVCFAYPSFRDSLAEIQLPDFYEGFLGEAGSITTPEGFVTAEWFSWVPALLAGVAIALGTATISGEERDGTLELTLAQPISRTRVLADKTLALAGGLVLAVAAVFPAFVFAMPLADISIAPGRIAGALVLTALLTLNFLALSLWLAALLPSRRAAAVLAVGVLVATFFLNTLGATVPALDGWRTLTPLYWADASLPLTGNVEWWRVAALVLGPPVLWALARDAFCRREIESGRLALPALPRVRRSAPDRAARARPAGSGRDGPGPR